MNSFIEKIKPSRNIRAGKYFSPLWRCLPSRFYFILDFDQEFRKSAALEISSEKKELEGKFILPGLKDSLMAGVKDVLK